MDLVSYEPSHLKNFDPGEHDMANTLKLGSVQGWDDKAVSARSGGRTLGICGVSVDEGTAHVWLVLSEEMRAKPVSLCRAAKASMHGIMNLPGVERIVVEPTHPASCRWLEWLGFESIDGKLIYGA